MAISDEWQDFIDDYGADGVYWYFPKGGTADKDDFREQFRVFDLYEGEIFTPELQARLGQALRDEGLSNAGDDFPRQIKRVFENLGLCWMEEGKPLRITPAGKLYLEEPPGPSKVLDQQVWRYQLPNPVNASDATEGIELHPHAYFVEALLACNGEITGEEFVLFISRALTDYDLEKSAERIRAWRDLPPGDRSDITQALHTTDYAKIRRDHTYSMAFHHCDLLLERMQGKIYVHGDKIDQLRRRLETHKGVSEIIDFKNSEPDVIAFYGDPEKKGTQMDALEHYIDVSDVENAVKIYRKLPKDVRGEATPEDFEQAQLLEKDLEDYLEKHLDKIESGLKLVERQHKTTVGSIDLFAEAKNGDLVVIELKKGLAADKVFGQICRYMGCKKSEQSSKGAKKVRGYIVGREIDIKLNYAAKVVDSGLIGLQVFEFKGEEGKEDWIQVSAI